MRKDPLPPLEALRTFAVAARELSFTHAAAELFVTQSAVSKQIRVLEDALGVRLFERQHRSLRLTEAGATLYRATDGAFAQLRETARRLMGADEPAVTLTTTPSLASMWLIPKLADFSRANPGIDVRLSTDTRVVDLDRGGYDLAIRSMPDAAAPAGARRLFGETVLVVCSPKLAGDPARPLRNAADLAHHTLLAYDDDQSRRPWLGWPTLLEVLGVPGLRPAATISFTQYDQLLRASIDGQGMAIANLSLVREALADGRLISPFAQRLETPRAYFVIANAQALRRPAVARFCDWVVGAAATPGVA
jgi:DNA-binding transcriptional LysR family regulator